MAQFVVPGLELEEVLGACKTPGGRERYGYLVNTAKTLAAYVDLLREDGELEPVKLAGAPAADPPSAAGAPPPASPAAVSRSTAPGGLPARWLTLVELSEHNYRLVLATFEQAAGELAPRDVARILELNVGQAGAALKTCTERGWLEHNGKLRTAARYTLTDTGLAELDEARAAADPTPAPEESVEALDSTPLLDALERERAVGDPETMPVDLDDEDENLDEDDGPGDGDYTTQPAGTAPINGVSPRVRRELEREERDRRRKAADARELDTGVTLSGRVTVSLNRATVGLDGGRTIPELATELGVTTGEELGDLAAVIAGLEDDGEVIRRGHRQRGNRRHVVYAMRVPSFA